VFDPDYAAHQIAAIVPRLQAERAVTRFEQEIVGCYGQGFFARLAQHGLAAGFEETLDGFADIGQWAAP
jgi:hypothetical protein